MQGIIHHWVSRAALLAVTVSALGGAPSAVAAETTGGFRQWGVQDLKHIDRTFWLPSQGLYAEDANPGQASPPNRPAFMWSCGVELSALNAAARLDSHTYLPQARRYLLKLDDYWVVDGGIGGYQTLPRPNTLDRFYDDNAWIVLDQADAYDLTHDRRILRRAEDTFRFVMSGEDETLGGGIYWHEKEKNSKNTCSNAPVIVGALRLYQITHDKAYLASARRLYAWVNAHLQDTDGLYWDNVSLRGSVEKTKWTYNTALMIRSNALFYRITQDKAYLAEAQRIARAAEARWVRPATGAIADDASFAHLLSESFLFLSEQDHDPHYLDVVRRALIFLHTHVRDAGGDYGGRWDRPRKPEDRVKLLAEASAARANLIAAPFLDGTHSPVRPQD